MLDRKTWHHNDSTAARTLSVIAGHPGFGLLICLAYGAHLVSASSPSGDALGRIVCLALYGTIDFSVDLDIAMLATLFFGIRKPVD